MWKDGMEKKKKRGPMTNSEENVILRDRMYKKTDLKLEGSGTSVLKRSF